MAKGGAEVGSWRMNDSKFHYVDDGTVAVADDGTVGVAWVDNRRQTVFFQSYDSNGDAQFGGPVGVSRSPEIFSWLPRMAVGPDGEEIFVLWQEIVFSGGSHGGEAFFARSTDGGGSFSEPINLSKTQNGVGKGRLTEKRWDNGSLDIARAADGTIYTAWTAYEGPLHVRRSTDGGRTFEPAVKVAGSNSRPARGPSLAVDGETVVVAWTVGEREAGDIHVAGSEDGGQTFGAPETVWDSDGHSDAPTIAFDDQGTLHLAFGESPSGMFGRYYVRYARRTEGDAFDEPRKLSGRHSGREGANFPSLAVDERDVYVLWEVYPNESERSRGLQLSVSEDAGGAFSDPAVVPGTGEDLPGFNASLQGGLGQKLDVNASGLVGVVNSAFARHDASRVRLVLGQSE